MNRIFSIAKWSFNRFLIKQKYKRHLYVSPVYHIQPSQLRFLHTRKSLTVWSLVKVYESSPTTMYLEFKDGVSANVSYIWLRDSCQCENCINPDNKQKMVATENLDMDIKPKSFNITADGRLQIVWKEDSKEDHISSFLPLWLHRYTLGFQMPTNTNLHDILPPKLIWKGMSLKETTINVPYHELMFSQEGVNKVLDNLYTYGITFLNNVPNRENEIREIIKRFTFVTNTKYGSSFHVVNTPGKPNLKNSEKYIDYLELHTDMNYLERSPGIQGMHCLEACYHGKYENYDKLSNDSVFVDGFAIADWMMDNFPSEFHTLTSLKVKFKAYMYGLNYSSRQHILKTDEAERISEVHYCNKTLAPFEGPAQHIADFYRSYKIFGNKLRDTEFQYSVLLKPGDAVIFDNRRILHGRNKGNPLLTARHIEGCHGDFDEMMARYRHIIRNKLLI